MKYTTQQKEKIAILLRCHNKEVMFVWNRQKMRIKIKIAIINKLDKQYKTNCDAV